MMEASKGMAMQVMEWKATGETGVRKEARGEAQRGVTGVAA
jgi:hypothetical protein